MLPMSPLTLLCLPLSSLLYAMPYNTPALAAFGLLALHVAVMVMVMVMVMVVVVATVAVTVTVAVDWFSSCVGHYSTELLQNYFLSAQLL
jgi:hypothetical protein